MERNRQSKVLPNGERGGMSTNNAASAPPYGLTIDLRRRAPHDLSWNAPLEITEAQIGRDTAESGITSTEDRHKQAKDFEFMELPAAGPTGH
jgi:hypothetical protein